MDVDAAKAAAARIREDLDLQKVVLNALEGAVADGEDGPFGQQEFLLTQISDIAQGWNLRQQRISARVTALQTALDGPTNA